MFSETALARIFKRHSRRAAMVDVIAKCLLQYESRRAQGARENVQTIDGTGIGAKELALEGTRAGILTGEQCHVPELGSDLLSFRVRPFRRQAEAAFQVVDIVKGGAHQPLGVR